MKRHLLILLIVAMVIPAAAQRTAQNQEPREFKVMVRDKKGRAIEDIVLAAGLKGSDGAAPDPDRYGDRSFRVTDNDTIVLLTRRNIYEFPVAGLDSLYVVFKNSAKIVGYTASDGSDELIDLGIRTVSRRNNTNAVDRLEPDNVRSYADLKSYMTGRTPGVSFQGDKLIIRGTASVGGTDNEALIVVDGSPQSNFSQVNATVTPEDVEQISVLKDAGSTAIYGFSGANGVVLIKTKSGGGKKK